MFYLLSTHYSLMFLIVNIIMYKLVASVARQTVEHFPLCIPFSACAFLKYVTCLPPTTPARFWSFYTFQFFKT